MGVKKYNSLCRGIVMRYAEQWEDIVQRLGRWIGELWMIKLYDDRNILCVCNVVTSAVVGEIMQPANLN